MGKSKNKSRRGKKASCPTGLPSVRDIKKEEEEFGSDSDTDVGHVADDCINVKPVVKSILEKLQSVGVEEKECACCILASIAEQKEALPLLLEYKIIKAVAPLMTSSSVTVRHASVGALRNLSVCGGHDFCEAMVEQDVLTPLVALFKKQYGPGWQPQKSVQGKIESVREIYVEALYLLCNLCESSSRAVHIFNKEMLATNLLSALNVETYGHRVAIAVASCLHTVSEDNRELIAILNHTVNTELLNKLLLLPNDNAGDVLLKVRSAGIILNMNCEDLSGCTPALLGSLMKSLADTLDIDAVPLIGAVIESKRSAKKCEKKIEDSSNEESIEWLLSAQQTALEILTNICCGNEKADMWEEMSNSDDSDEHSCFDASLEDGAAMKFPLSVSAEIHEQFISHDFMHKALNKVNLQELCSSPTTQKDAVGKQLFTKLFTIQARALLCINNIATCLDVHDLGGPSKLYELWINLGQLVFQITEETQPEVLEATTSAMSSIIKKLAEIKSNQFEQFSLADLQKICDLMQQASDPSIKVNLIRIMGSLGCLLGNLTVPNCILLLKYIGTFLLGVCNKDCDLWVESEALDAIFDVFAEDDTDDLLFEIGALEKLKGILPILKHKINIQGKIMSDHLPVIMTAKVNLMRFIKYKTQMHSSNGNHH